MNGPNRAEELQALAEPVRSFLDAANEAREKGLAACRKTIRACGSACVLSAARTACAEGPASRTRPRVAITARPAA